MKHLETSIVAGVDCTTDNRLPGWFEREHHPETVCSFTEAIRRLSRAVETDVAYRNLHTDAWVETERFNALVEPTRASAESEDTDTDADPLFHIPTASYSIINLVDVYASLENVLREHSLEDRPLGEVVFGEIRQYRAGREVHMDLMFDGLEVSLPGRTEPITMGVTSGDDFFGGHAVYVEGVARDNACANSIRSLTDRRVVKHVGEIEHFGAWWESLLGRLELIAEDFRAFILDASEITIDFRNVPFTIHEFYELLGFAEYLATEAGNDARLEAADPFDIDMLTLHSGATHALTHAFRGRRGVHSMGTSVRRTTSCSTPRWYSAGSLAPMNGRQRLKPADLRPFSPSVPRPPRR